MSCPPLKDCSKCGHKSTSLTDNVNHWIKEHPSVSFYLAIFCYLYRNIIITFLPCIWMLWELSVDLYPFVHFKVKELFFFSTSSGFKEFWLLHYIYWNKLVGIGLSRCFEQYIYTGFWIEILYCQFGRKCCLERLKNKRERIKVSRLYRSESWFDIFYTIITIKHRFFLTYFNGVWLA